MRQTLLFFIVIRHGMFLLNETHKSVLTWQGRLASGRMKVKLLWYGCEQPYRSLDNSRDWRLYRQIRVPQLYKNQSSVCMYEPVSDCDQYPQRRIRCILRYTLILYISANGEDLIYTTDTTFEGSSSSRAWEPLIPTTKSYHP